MFWNQVLSPTITFLKEVHIHILFIIIWQIERCLAQSFHRLSTYQICELLMSSETIYIKMVANFHSSSVSEIEDLLGVQDGIILCTFSAFWKGFMSGIMYCHHSVFTFSQVWAAFSPSLMQNLLAQVVCNLGGIFMTNYEYSGMFQMLLICI